MRNITIQKNQYEILDTLYGLNIPDSFVNPKNKIGGGNGEAKLYVGNENQELINFFGARGFKISCFLLKNDLVRFLDETRTEYLNPTQDYRNINDLPGIWEDKKNKLQQYPEKIEFSIQDQNNLQGPRIYVNS